MWAITSSSTSRCRNGYVPLLQACHPSGWASRNIRSRRRVVKTSASWIQSQHRHYTVQARPSAVLHDVQRRSAEDKVLVFRSSSFNPYHNLAIENFLLRNSNPESKILLFYTNWPSVIIGRNQNPWVECNLARIREGLFWNPGEWSGLSCEGAGTQRPLDLVRRRSGGGTVVHDVGNLNFSVLVPNDATFTRARHAEMVVQALHTSGVYDGLKKYRQYESLRVNERNDIVMKPLVTGEESSVRELKVSGSAYKLTRGRALHHGTLLHSSPNIKRQGQGDSVFGQLLRSPGRDFIDAKGVASVPSPIHNTFDVSTSSAREDIKNAAMEAIIAEFREMYPSRQRIVFEVGDHDCKADTNPKIFDDAQELMTDAWRFEQTPAFEYQSSPGVEGAQTNTSCWFRFKARTGVIQEAQIQFSNSPKSPDLSITGLLGKILHKVSDWEREIPQLSQLSAQERTFIVKHLQNIFPAAPFPHSKVDQDDNTTEVARTYVQVEAANTQVTGRVLKDGRVETEKEGENLIEERPGKPQLDSKSGR